MKGSGDTMSEDSVDIAIEHVSSSGSIVATITTAVMAATDREDPPNVPLYDAVDPDILEWIVDDADDDSVRVGFEYFGCEVMVRGDGMVAVIPSEHRDRPDGYNPLDAVEHYRELDED